jgi:hypothetical protein
MRTHTDRNGVRRVWVMQECGQEEEQLNRIPLTAKMVRLLPIRMMLSPRVLATTHGQAHSRKK